MFLGLRTVIYYVSDLEKGKKWYSDLVGKNPYFDQPFYVGFNVGGYELGLDPNMEGFSTSDVAVAYWGVENADKAYNRLLELGASVHKPVQDVGEGIRVGSVSDPFGNVIGIIENPNFSLPKHDQ